MSDVMEPGSLQSVMACPHFPSTSWPSARTGPYALTIMLPPGLIGRLPDDDARPRHGADRAMTPWNDDRDWAQHVNEVADSTLYPLANLWAYGRERSR